MAKTKGETSSNDGFGLGKVYLLIYNIVQTLGWGYVFAKVLEHYITGQEGRVYDQIGSALIIFQTGAILEVLNVAIGLVRSDLATTTMQVTSRLFIVWVGFVCIPETQGSIGVPLLLFAWCITEIVRYSFYATGLLNITPYFIVWIRYTFFYALYPIGVTGELFVTFAAIAVTRETKVLSIEMPNKFNFTFCLEYALYAVVLNYIIFFPSLYGYMIRQRKKVIGGQDPKKSN